MSRKEQFSANGRPQKGSVPGRGRFRRVGDAGLVVALLGALALTAEHLAGIGLPGCGAAGGCAEAARSVFARIPLGAFAWPVAHVALAYFAATAVLRWGVGLGMGRVAIWAARAAALASGFYLVVSVVEGLLCPYCIAVHVGNLAFWGCAEAERERRARGRTLVAFGAVLVGVSAILGAAEWRAHSRAAMKAAEELQRTTREVIERPAAKRFTGRYRQGPPDAPVRIVVISDYQCVDCKKLEAEIEALLAARSDVSFSPKHFPFCKDCNKHVPRTLHANACWAARAAEAAGMMKGTEGFFAMHRWLFGRGGGFTEAELNAGLASMGLEQARFVALMTGEETLKFVQADIDEAASLGLSMTPMVFINGVELKGWQTPGALAAAAAKVAASVQKAGLGAEDRPLSAIAKFVADWEEQPEILAREFEARRALGAGKDAKVRIVIFGDYQEPATAEADGAAREISAARADVRYVFAHFPADSACNPAVPTRLHPLACTLARAAEAAGRQGEPAFWKAHAFLLANQGKADGGVGDLAAALGLEKDVLGEAMQGAEVRAAIAADVAMGAQLKLTEVPTVFVNGKRLPRWKGPGQTAKEVLGAVVERAAEGGK